MSNLFKRLKVSKALIIAALVLLAVFSACDLPMGLGDPIDFIPPILTVTGYSVGDSEELFPITTPLYVRSDIKLIGVVVDEGGAGVDYVELRDAANDEVMKTETMPNGRAIIMRDSWSMPLDFDSSRNGEKLTLKIVAFDKANNSGDRSIKNITIIIDIRPPIIEDMYIKRSATREAFLESFICGKPNCRCTNPQIASSLCVTGLKNESTRGKERIANVNRYQNGIFHVLGTVSEEETRIDIITLNFYDIDKDINEPIVKLQRTLDSSSYSPRWLVNEAEILAAGEALWPGYTAAYIAGADYAYRVAIEAYDRSLNEGTTILEEEGHFLLSYNADIPKGNVDPIVGNIVTRNGTIPVEFFDDDTLSWAYAGLLTYEQWNGITAIAPGDVKIPAGEDEAKLAFLQSRLRANPPLPVYNWRYCSERPYGDDALVDANLITELIKGQTLTERTIYVPTGSSEFDYGQFVLFTLVEDKKTSPHTNNGPNDTNRSRSIGRHWDIDVIDENAPLIVLDVLPRCDHGSGLHDFNCGDNWHRGSPEENTFPDLTDGEFFTIRGYTLRENGNETNGVVRLRMAWIPFEKENGADNYITDVQNALSDEDYPAQFSNPALEGVQYWDFGFSNVDDPGFQPATSIIQYYRTETEQEQIGTGKFRNQSFMRTFSILGNDQSTVNAFVNSNIPNVKNKHPLHPENPSTNSAWKDFTYKTRENENKLFIIFAECNMGHKVFRQMRLLRNGKPPTLNVYDISIRILRETIDGLSGTAIPDVNLPVYGGGTPNAAYYAALKTYNNQNVVHNLLKGIPVDNSVNSTDRAAPFKIYPRGSIVKYLVNAVPNGDLSVNNITIRDITNDAAGQDLGSIYDKQENALTFAELYPDETQRVFLFEAEDSLGNKAQIQRTVAITSTAMLESITTTTQSGTYGIGEEIILQANFTSQINIVSGSNNSLPQLNIRYPYQNGQYEIVSLNPEPVTGSVMSLQFKFTVPEPITVGGTSYVALGQLITMYGDVLLGGSVPNETNRPLRLNGAQILDAMREGTPAFIPGYTITTLTGTSTLENWNNDLHSLQNPTGNNAHKKDIKLDAIRPVISSVTVSGKNAWINNSSVQTNEFYFKTGETINVTLITNTPNKSINQSNRATDIEGDSGNLRLSYQIREENSTIRPTATTYYNTNFTYQRPQGTTGMVFALTVNDAANNTSTPFDGEIINISLHTGTGIRTIVDEVGNEAPAVSNLTTIMPAGTRIYVKKSTPPMPDARLIHSSTPTDGRQIQDFATGVIFFNSNPTLRINDSTGSNINAAWNDIKQYSTNGGLQWTRWTADASMPSGEYKLQTRYQDRAGNIGLIRERDLHVEANFPRLLAVIAEQPEGKYRIGQRLDFQMGFADDVNYTNAANVTITLRDTTASAAQNTITLQATGGSGTSTITFAWTGNTGNNAFIDKDMLNGLIITSINMSGLNDKFGNAGPASVAATASQIQMPALGSNAAYTVLYSLSGNRVSTIAPSLQSATPVSAQGRPAGNMATSVSADNRTITLNFSKGMQVGNGMITIRPYGTYAIPAVMENEGYYIEIDSNGLVVNDAQGFEVRHTTGGNNRVYIAGFADVFGSGTTANKQSLLGTPASGTVSITNPAISLQTGLGIGPYIMMSNGLSRGMGYSGNYGNTAVVTADNADAAGTTIALPGINAPGTRNFNDADKLTNNYMVPDLTTKWVLHYGYNDLFATGTPTGRNVSVTNIRAAFTNAKWRWQEFAVTSSSVVVSGSTVTITLPEPLLPGLQWTLDYDEGTFTDTFGNAAPAVGTYWFLSGGAQRPVIRVDRKSYDARAGTDLTGAWNKTGWSYNATGFNGAITSFNTINYVITTETPNSSIYYGTSAGTEANLGSTIGAWGGRVNTTAYSSNNIAASNVNWGGPLATITTTARAATTNQYTSNTHNLGETGRVFYATVTSGTTTGEYWLRVTGAATFRLYTSETTARNATIQDGIGTLATVITIDSVQTIGRWVRPNLIFRHHFNGAYNVMLDGGNNSPLNVGGTLQGANNATTLNGRYYGFRSYNKDALLSELNAVTAGTTAAGQNIIANFSYSAYQASKNYVIAETRVNHGSTQTTASSPKAYEGVFRTVVMNNMYGVTVPDNTNPIIMFGTTAFNAIPTVAAFPVKDGVGTVDARFGKFYFRDESSTVGNADRNRYYWVSSEIVCSWIIQNFGRGTGGSYTRKGDARDWISAGYGDLTYSHNIQAW